MKKKILLLSIFSFLILIIGASTIEAAQGFYHHLHGCERVVGTIQEIGRNTIIITDEADKISKQFVYLNNKEQFHAGDRVRIYYQIKGSIIEDIKKMTPVEYKGKGQNIGYIFKK